MTNTNAQVTSSPMWFKSSYSEGSGNACVEVAFEPRDVLVRDSKDVAIPHFKVSATAWSAFVNHAAR